VSRTGIRLLDHPEKVWLHFTWWDGCTRWLEDCSWQTQMPLWHDVTRPV